MTDDQQPSTNGQPRNGFHKPSFGDAGAPATADQEPQQDPPPPAEPDDSTRDTRQQDASTPSPPGAPHRSSHRETDEPAKTDENRDETLPAAEPAGEPAGMQARGAADPDDPAAETASGSELPPFPSPAGPAGDEAPSTAPAPPAAEPESASATPAADTPPAAPAEPTDATDPAGGHTAEADQPAAETPQKQGGRARRRWLRARKQPTDDEPYRKKHMRSRPGDQEFFVPVPGGRLHGGRGVSVGLRWTALVMSGLLLLGACGASGLLGVGILRGSADEGVDTQALQHRYRLDTFNTAAGVAFAARYLRLCLWRPTDGQTNEQRMSTLDDMNAAAQAEVCSYTGIDSEDPTARTVTSTTFTGYSQPVNGMPSARYLGLAVSTSDGTTAHYVVPVYFDQPRRGVGPRIVGTVGVLPLPKMGDPPAGGKPTVDPDLSAKLTHEFLPEFMSAWVSSSATLNAFLATNATVRASTGLGDAYTDPTVTAVTVHPPPAAVSESGTKFTYSEGMRIHADVAVQLTSHSGLTQTFTYRVTLLRSTDRWFVEDIHAGSQGLLTSEGDGDNATGTPLDPSISPSPSPSASTVPTPPGAAGPTVDSNPDSRRRHSPTPNGTSSTRSPSESPTKKGGDGREGVKQKHQNPKSK